MNRQSFFRYIASLDKNILFFLTICFELIIFWGDYVTGPLAPFTHFYLVPIIVAGLFLDKKLAYLVTALATISGVPVFQQPFLIYTPPLLWLNVFSDAAIFFTVLTLTFQLKNLLSRLEEQANTDFLTKASSRRFFTEACNIELARAFRDKRPASLVFIDLDNFKQVNDTQGHHKGDELLVKVAASIMASLRGSDLFGRLGGDEFAILLHQTTETQAKTLIVRLKENLLRTTAKLNTNVTFSIGVVSYLAEKQTSADALLALADSAMYSIKNSTKNAIKFACA
jgi:diguanylate cyclase (GGDEF)-like protein